MIRRLILALTLVAGISPAFAQPAPVPALPDTERRTTYSITGTTCACNVNFALYGDGTDFQNWVEVWLNGVRVNYNDPTFGWNITSPSGSLSAIARPITDAVLSFLAPQTGTVQIVGARRPRRASQYPNGGGVPTRDFNRDLTDIIAQNRELWDKTNDMTGRGVFAVPGETMNPLPPASQRASMGVCFDAGGSMVPCIGIPSGSMSAGSGITFTGTGPTVISTATFSAGTGILFTGTAPTVISVPSATAVFSPLSYGAKCDGVTHDEVALQNALNAAIAANGTLQLPVGTCISNADITNAGSFINTVIKGFGDASQVTFLGNHGFAFGALASSYVMQDFTFSCASTSTHACAAITHASQSAALGSIIQHTKTNSCGAICWQFQNTGQITFINNVIQTTSSTGQAALYVDNTATADVGPNVFASNTIVNVGGTSTYGIYQLNAGGTQNTHNNIGGYAYDIYHDNNMASGAATGIIDQGNQLDNYTTGGIYFNSSGLGGAIIHVAVNNNTMHALQSGSGSLGIAFVEAPGSVSWAANISVTGNTIDTYSGTGGILLAGSSGFAVTGNSIRDEGTPTGAGIKTNGSSGTCMVLGNVVTVYSTHFTNSATCSTSGATN